MEENFEPVARTRANYYTPGSPVQFVCVELLKGEVSGEHAVCLTFKNISRVTLTALETRMNRPELKYQPQVFENGWYCACGAFHPKEEDTVYCSECGSDRILLQNALNTLLQPEAPVRQPEPQPAAQPVRPAAPAEEPTRIVGAAQEEATRIIPPRAAEPAPGYAPAAEMDATRVVSRAPEQDEAAGPGGRLRRGRPPRQHR